MTLTRSARPRHALVAAALLVSSLAVATLGTGPTESHAATGISCDPIVTLSNGAVVHLTATIYDSVTDITSVAYVMHAPVGTSVLSVVYPLDPNGIPQTFAFYADNPQSVWDTYTTASTGAASVSVTATAQVANFSTYTASGLSNQGVHTHAVVWGGYSY